MSNKLVKVGSFCPNEACDDYEKVDDNNIVKYGKTRKGVQRFFCKTCEKAFSATKNTLFYCKQTPKKDILETLSLLADGVRITSISRAKGFKEDTILNWLRQATLHAQEVEELLLKDYKVSRSQIDGLWAYVKNKGKKKVT